MVAGIEIFANGEAGFVNTRSDAWHRLGETIPQGTSILDGMRIGHLLGWDVRKLAVFAEEIEITESGVTTHRIPGTGRFLTVRTNPVTGEREMLGDVGERYTVIQNEEHAEFLETLVDVTGAQIETAGSLFSGRRVFVSMKMPESIVIGGQDVTDLYLIALNSHDGTTGFDVCVSAIRPVCHNTVTAAFRGAKSRVSIRHTATARGRVQDAREALDMSFKYAGRFQEAAEDMLATTMTDADFDAFLAELYEAGDEPSTRKQNVMQEVRNLWSGSPTLQDAKGTRYGAFQAVTEYTTHFSGAHGQSEQERTLNRAQRDVLDSTFRTRALELLSA